MRMSTNPYCSRVASTPHQEKVLEGVAIWAAYYRSNIHRFVEDYLHITLKLFQIILLVMMDKCATFVLISSRGLGKTFLSAVFCVARCILYPGTLIVVSSGTRGQSINVLEKIMNEIRPRSRELAMEIDDKETKTYGQDAKIVFRNGSVIKVVTANDNSRGNRANILLIDEFRMVKKDVIDTILKKFQATPRHPGFMDKPEYKDRRDLQERNKTLYLSSAYYKDHWSYTRCRDSCRFMLDDTRSNFVCGLPYELAIEEGLLMEEEVLEQITETDFSEIKFSMEMEALWFGDADGTFFNFDTIAKNRRLEYAMLPERLSSMLPSANKLKIPPKLPGEKRILSADIALMVSGKNRNDATAIFVNQMLPTKAGRYVSNIVYTESNEGLRTEEEALIIRRLYDEFDCDWIVLDTQGLGLGVYDAIASDLADPLSGEIYPALSCCNNVEMEARCTNKKAPKKVWSIKGSSRFNSDCAILLREGFRSGRIRLLSTEYDADELLGQVSAYGKMSMSDRLMLTMPYLNTTLLINELINLCHEETGGVVRIMEKSGMRKDRYSSLAYNYFVAMQVEKDIHRKAGDELGGERDEFIFRAPKTKREERW